MCKGGIVLRPNKKGKKKWKRCNPKTHHKRIRIMQDIVQSYYREIKGKEWQTKGGGPEETLLTEETRIEKEKGKEKELLQQKSVIQLKKLITEQRNKRKQIRNITLLSDPKGKQR